MWNSLYNATKVHGPFNLPLADTEYRTVVNGGLFGALRDSAPDFWGRTVIERTDRPANELDYLLATSDVRVGALSFGRTPEPPVIDYLAGVPMARLESAANAAAAIEAEMAGERLEVELDPALLDPSSGRGCARPKTVASDAAGQLWARSSPRGSTTGTTPHRGALPSSRRRVRHPHAGCARADGRNVQRQIRLPDLLDVPSAHGLQKF